MFPFRGRGVVAGGRDVSRSFACNPVTSVRRPTACRDRRGRSARGRVSRMPRGRSFRVSEDAGQPLKATYPTARQAVRRSSHPRRAARRSRAVSDRRARQRQHRDWNHTEAYASVLSMLGKGQLGGATRPRWTSRHCANGRFLSAHSGPSRVTAWLSPAPCRGRCGAASGPPSTRAGARIVATAMAPTRRRICMADADGHDRHGGAGRRARPACRPRACLPCWEARCVRGAAWAAADRRRS